jgi:hypothetical protein
MLVAWALVNGHLGLPALGVRGTALGATIARSAGGLLVLVVLVRGRGSLRLDRVPWPELDMLKRLIHIGLPSGGEQLAFQGALILFARLVTGLGTIAFAAHNTVLTIESISFLPGAGFATAATTLVGQGLGAQDPDSARWSGNESFRQAVIFMAGMGVLFILVLVFGVLRPVLNNITGNGKKQLAAFGGSDVELGGMGGLDGELANDRVSLGGPQSILLPSPSEGYDAQLNAIKSLVAEDPGRVAQVVKEWINADE